MSWYSPKWQKTVTREEELLNYYFFYFFCKQKVFSLRKIEVELCNNDIFAAFLRLRTLQFVAVNAGSESSQIESKICQFVFRSLTGLE